jgi:phosphate transport system permease protein
MWVAVGLTVGILLFIVLYIIFRGMVADNLVSSPFLGIQETAVPISEGEESLSVIVNSGVRVSSLSAENLQALFGGELTNWGEISGQDLSCTVVLLDQPASLAAASSTLLGEASLWAKTSVTLASPTAVLSKVADTDGAIGWISSQDLPRGGSKGVRVIQVRELTALVHPGVVALSEGRRLTGVSEAQMKSLLRGEVSNWRQLGGPNLPLRLITLGPKSWENQAVARYLSEERWAPPSGAQMIDDPENLSEAVHLTPGSLCICPWRHVGPPPHDHFLEVQTRQVKRNLTLSYFFEEPRRSGRVGGVSTIILNTVLMILLTLLFTTPIGVGAAIYLTEYIHQGRLVKILRFGTETLAGIPSIIFGLFGFIVFVTILRMGIGLISGTLTITIMLLPTIIRTSEEAIRSVSMSLREGSLALGATKWQTTMRVTVPAAIPGIMTGVILAVGRAVGETAALLFTMGTDYRLVQGLGSSARTLSVHLFYLLKEGISDDRAFATGTVLIIIILIVNLTTTRLIGRMNLMRKTGNRNGHAA